MLKNYTTVICIFRALSSFWILSIWISHFFLMVICLAAEMGMLDNITTSERFLSKLYLLSMGRLTMSLTVIPGSPLNWALGFDPVFRNCKSKVLFGVDNALILV
uniref:Uncharacterized protein n=1 Tax=Diadromus pulchellus ascovirus 4a TaxID=158683 RepID=Q9DST5_9VIRU|nr:hypothetical protein [Diadromus pulchellus ascovirus 4a]